MGCTRRKKPVKKQNNNFYNDNNDNYNNYGNNNNNYGNNNNNYNNDNYNDNYEQPQKKSGKGGYGQNYNQNVVNKV